MLLAAGSTSELLIATEAHFTQLDSLGNIGQKSFQIYKTLDVQNHEVVLEAHMVDTPFHTGKLFVTEEADAQRLKSSLDMGRVFFLNCEWLAITSL